MNPLLSREIRARWRDGRAFGLVFFFAAGFSLLLTLIYGSRANALTGAPGQWAILGQTLFGYLAWIQTLAWILVAPALTSSAISYERERGWFDSLILSPLLPRQISLGKWSCALLYAAMLYAVTLPCTILVVLLGGITAAQFWLVVALHALCASCGAAVGLAASAWSYRSHAALRSANGLFMIWLLTSYGGATWSGKTSISRMVSSWGSGVPSFWEWLGRTNPVVCASQIASGSPAQDWPLVFSILGTATLFFLWVATYYARRPLEEAPYVEPRRRKKDAPPLQSHGEVPLVTRLKFHNPVLDHEVRAKFRMRQPPFAVIVVECLLALLVAGFYLRTFYWALFVPKFRITIWAGLIITAMIVTMMSAAVMGGNGFSREREKGTWEAIQLSMLSAGEIVRGKVFASIWTCLLFSLPVLPLLLPCIDWMGTARGLAITPLKALWCGLIWLATVWSFTLVGLWIGRRQTRSSRASGQALGLLGGYVILGPIAISTLLAPQWADPIATTMHPLATVLSWSLRKSDFGFFESGPSYFLFHFVIGLVVWVAVQRDIARELNQREASQ